MRLSFWFLGHCESVFILLRGIAARLGRHADATADDLSDCLNYNQTPLPFQTINAPIPAAHFLHDPRPVVPPDND